ncbi:unnamed protein product [Didymodactylos carnosus]|uniref:GGDEF domain-containing protein n=1 Tax=Didymodactylos carnosus TaxID=1234261 RepID=A0A8S2DCW2_9BILA|nr:unnamed protein product [Didymodactylos carnosus]CAF3646470.1 unnamed protein product [Didymodactylos carnosus]
MIDASDRVIVATGVIDRRYGKSLLGKKVGNVSSSFFEAINAPNTVHRIELSGAFFDVIYTPMNRTFILKDMSQVASLISRVDDSQPVIATIYLDNFMKVVKNSDELLALTVENAIKTAMLEWAKQNHIFLKSYSPDTYVAVVKHKDYRSLLDTKFDILEQVKKIALNNGLEIALTMGFAFGESSLFNLFQLSQEAMQLGLGRGGDQVVIKQYGQPAIFFGAKSEARADDSSLEVKFFTHELKNVIAQFSDVLIMGHRFGDFDLVGSALAIAYIVRNSGASAQIILNEETMETKALTSIRALAPKLRKEFISPTKAIKLITDRPQTTLLVIVDASDKT